jgi:hypothetical protein
VPKPTPDRLSRRKNQPAVWFAFRCWGQGHFQRLPDLVVTGLSPRCVLVSRSQIDKRLMRQPNATSDVGTQFVEVGLRDEFDDKFVVAAKRFAVSGQSIVKHRGVPFEGPCNGEQRQSHSFSGIALLIPRPEPVGETTEGETEQE